MNRNIAIVEDEVEEAETLRSYFARYTQEYGTTFTVTHFLSAEAFLNRYRPVYDLVPPAQQAGRPPGGGGAGHPVRPHDPPVRVPDQVY